MRHPRVRNEDGAELVEFAIAIPLALLLVFGVIELGVFISRNISATQGVREAARQAAVANYAGSATACNGAPNDAIRCFARDRIGLGSGPTSVAVTILLPQGVAIGNEVGVCASAPSNSLTGLIKPFLPKFQHVETKMRIEQLPPPGQILTAGGDPPLAGDSWDWCTA